MRLIDADALYDKRVIRRTSTGEVLVSVDAEYILNAPTIQPAAQTEPTWHDLLENPDDLPTGGQHVLIAYDYDSETGKYWDCDIGEYWSCRDSPGNVEGWCNTTAKVIAWKEFD